MKSYKFWLITIALALMSVLILSDVAALRNDMPIPIASNNPTWSLAWSDEFNGTSVNTNDWVFNVGGDGWGNNELQYYTNGQNATVQNGELIITAKKEGAGYGCWYGSCNYTSTRMTTKGKHEFKYGRIESRLKLPSGQGLWPAFWMLGSSLDQAGWPASGEIDIMEHINTEDTVYGTIHWDDGGHVSYGCPSSPVIPTVDVTQYHVYDIEWDTDKITWHVDGALYCKVNIQNGINGTDELHEPFFILLNLAVGGNWPGSPDVGTAFPSAMYVDYVRVYSPPPTFTDVPFDHPLYKYIQALYDAGFTAGCSSSPLMFCPDTILDRAQSAVFMLRGAKGSGYTPPPAPWINFVNESWVGFEWAQPWAEGMYQEGLTAGCQTNPLMFCPANQLPRVEASIFGLKMKYGVKYTPPPATGTLFADFPSTDPSYWGIAWAEKAYVDGLLPACGKDSISGKPMFCPGELVNRAWGAYLIVKAKGLPVP